MSGSFFFFIDYLFNAISLIKILEIMYKYIKYN